MIRGDSLLQEELVRIGIDWVTNYYPYENPVPVGVERLEKTLVKHVKNGSVIAIFPDSDVDGFTSASIFWLYLKELMPDIKIHYYLR